MLFSGARSSALHEIPTMPYPIGSHVHGTHLLDVTSHRFPHHLHLLVHRHNANTLDVHIQQVKPDPHSTRKITTLPHAKCIYPGPSDNYLEPAPHSWVTSIPGPLGLTMQQSTTFAEPQQPSPLGPHVHGTHLLVTATLHRLSLHLAYHCLHHLWVHLDPHSGHHNANTHDMLFWHPR